MLFEDFHFRLASTGCFARRLGASGVVIKWKLKYFFSYLDWTALHEILQECCFSRNGPRCLHFDDLETIVGNPVMQLIVQIDPLLGLSPDVYSFTGTFWYECCCIQSRTLWIKTRTAVVRKLNQEDPEGATALAHLFRALQSRLGGCIREIKYFQS